MAQLLSSSNLLSQSRSLRSKYVYYQQLADYDPGTIQRRAYDDIKAEARTVFGKDDTETGALVRKLANSLRTQAMIEAEKEVGLLHDYFDVDIPVKDMYSKDIGKQITQAFNYAFSLKDVFKRNVNLEIGNAEKGITKNVKPTITQVLPSYMITAIQNNWDGIKNRVSGRIARGATPEEAFEAEFSSANMDRIVEEALDAALSSRITNRKDDKSDPFAELRGYLESDSTTKDFIIEQMKKNLGINALKKDLIEEFKNGYKFSNYRKGANDEKAKTVAKVLGKGTQRGIMAEVMGKCIAEAAVALNGKNYSFQTGWTGPTGSRPDFVLTFDVNVDKIMKDFDIEKGDKSREVNRKRAIAIARRLEKLKKGYLVYVNAKDWGQNADFKGFGAVSDMTLGKYSTIMKSTGSNALVGAIANTLQGAALEDSEYREDAIMALSSDIARLLFDDVFTVGKAMPRGVQTLHLMYLNGIYVPLSCILWLLAEAFEDSEKYDYKNLFRVTLSYKEPNILYPTGNPKGSYRWTGADWAEQKQAALDGIHIKAKLLKDFEQFVGDMIGRL